MANIEKAKKNIIVKVNPNYRKIHQQTITITENTDNVIKETVSVDVIQNPNLFYINLNNSGSILEWDLNEFNLIEETEINHPIPIYYYSANYSGETTYFFKGNIFGAFHKNYIEYLVNNGAVNLTTGSNKKVLLVARKSDKKLIYYNGEVPSTLSNNAANNLYLTNTNITIGYGEDYSNMQANEHTTITLTLNEQLYLALYDRSAINDNVLPGTVDMQNIVGLISWRRN